MAEFEPADKHAERGAPLNPGEYHDHYNRGIRLQHRYLNEEVATSIQRASSLAAACAQLGDHEAARRAASQCDRPGKETPAFIRAQIQSVIGKFWRLAYPYLNDDSIAHMLDGLKQADIPT